MDELCIKLSVNDWMLPADIVDEILAPADFIDRIVIVCEDEYDIYLKERFDIKTCKREMSKMFEKVGFVPALHYLIY